MLRDNDGMRVWGHGDPSLCLGRSARAQGGLPKDVEKKDVFTPHTKKKQSLRSGKQLVKMCGEVRERGALSWSLNYGVLFSPVTYIQQIQGEKRIEQTLS